MADEIEYIKLAHLEVPIIPSIAGTADASEGVDLGEGDREGAASAVGLASPNGNCWGC
jgi:hypothetical protein